MKPTTRARVQGKGSLIARLKIGKMFSLSEPELARLILEIENDPIFKKLNEPSGLRPKAVFKRRYPHTCISGKFYEINEEVQAGSQSVDVESILSKRKGMASLIKKVGVEKFEKFFVYQDAPYTLNNIAEECGIALEEAKEIQSLMLELSIHSEFVQPSSIVPGNVTAYTAIAKIEMDQDSSPSISYFSPHLARGRYVINREQIELIKRELPPMERKSLPQLLKRMEWINLRQDTFQKTLSELILRQESYLRTRNRGKLLPFTQRALAKELSVAPSTICRLVVGKSVIMPWDEEKPLKELFFSQKEAILHHLNQILARMTFDQKKKISDNELRELLIKQFHFKISRRSINLYRRQIQKENEK